MSKYILLFCAVYALSPCNIFADTITDSITLKQPPPLPKPDPNSLERTIPSSIQLPVHKNGPQPHVSPSVSIIKQPIARPVNQLKSNEIRHHEKVVPKSLKGQALQPQPNELLMQAQKDKSLQKTDAAHGMSPISIKRAKVAGPAQDLHYNHANQRIDNNSATLSNNPSHNRQKPIPSIKHVSPQLKPHAQQINQGVKPGTSDRSVTPRHEITAPVSAPQNADAK